MKIGRGDGGMGMSAAKRKPAWICRINSTGKKGKERDAYVQETRVN